MSIAITVKKIKKLEEKHSLLIKQILEVQEMVKGSYGETYRKCGKSTCWCAKNERGHSFFRITWSEKGKTRTKSIPEQDIDWITLKTQAYRNFRNQRHELRISELLLKELLNQFEKSVAAKTTSLKNYLSE